MTVNKKIEDALSDLVENNIWPLSCPQETLPDEWITYNPELERPEIYGDDDDLEWAHYMQVHWFRRGDGAKSVNCTDMRKMIRKRLKEAGFSVTGIVTLFENDTRTTHLVFKCNILEDDLYSE